MAFFTTRHTEQPTEASTFEQDVLAIANDHSIDMTQVDENGHSLFYNLFNQTIDVYGDRQQEVRK